MTSFLFANQIYILIYQRLFKNSQEKMKEINLAYETITKSIASQNTYSCKCIQTIRIRCVYPNYTIATYKRCGSKNLGPYVDKHRLG